MLPNATADPVVVVFALPGVVNDRTADHTYTLPWLPRSMVCCGGPQLAISSETLWPIHDSITLLTLAAHPDAAKKRVIAASIKGRNLMDTSSCSHDVSFSRGIGSQRAGKVERPMAVLPSDDWALASGGAWPPHCRPRSSCSSLRTFVARRRSPCPISGPSGASGVMDSRVERFSSTSHASRTSRSGLTSFSRSHCG
jgi:hypothetical protein